MKKTAELLGVDTQALSGKCSDYSSLYIKQVITNGMDREALIAFAKEHFTQEDFLYMSLIWMNANTDETFKQIIAERIIKKNNENPST